MAGRSVVLVAFACGWWAVGPAGMAVEYRMSLEGSGGGWVGASGFEHSILHASTGGVTHADVTIKRPVDQVSIALAARMCDGTALPLVRFDVKDSGPDRVRYYAIRMHDVLVSSYQLHAAGATDTAPESVSFNYAQIEWTYIETDLGGRPGSATSTTWNVSAGVGGASDPDSDGDGIPDSYEVQQGLKPLVADADADDDGDGMKNGDEYWAGTAAGNPNSFFHCTGIAIPAGATVHVRVKFDSVPGRTYDLHAAATPGGLAAATIPVGVVTATNSTTTIDLTLPPPLSFVKATVRPP